MRKPILPFLCLIVCLAILRPFCVYGAAPLDPGADASLTLRYEKDGKAFPDLQVRLYRVAEAFPDGTFELVAPFSSYRVNIHGITMQEQWKSAAVTLSAYITANSLTPDREGQTDAQGIAHFTDLPTGLYLVREVVAEDSQGTYLFNQFLIYLPTPQSDGTYQYDMEAKPKCTSFIPKTQYTVTKLWQDGGYQADRPKEVTVEIYQDGVLYQTQILSPDNNWTYSWYVSGEDPGQWTVAERSVPDSYTVTIQQTGGTFSIINTRQAQPETPQTGDSFAPLPWILAMCISGILLLMLGLYNRRRK